MFYYNTDTDIFPQWSHFGMFVQIYFEFQLSQQKTLNIIIAMFEEYYYYYFIMILGPTRKIAILILTVNLLTIFNLKFVYYFN